MLTVSTFGRPHVGGLVSSLGPEWALSNCGLEDLVGHQVNGTVVLLMTSVVLVVSYSPCGYGQPCPIS